MKNNCEGTPEDYEGEEGFKCKHILSIKRKEEIK